MSGPQRPTYALTDIQRLVRAGAYEVTSRARIDAAALGFDESDIVRCVLGLTVADFYKTMPAHSVPGLWQDVYRPVFDSEVLYVKLQVRLKGNAVVISFKEL